MLEAAFFGQLLRSGFAHYLRQRALRSNVHAVLAWFGNGRLLSVDQSAGPVHR
jgi:hypothetical protein